MAIEKFTDLPKALQDAIGDGRIFHARFLRRNDKPGEERVRDMFARTGVGKYVTGKGMSYDPKTRALLTVYDMTESQYIADSVSASPTPLSDAEIFEMKRKGYRMISLDGLIYIKLNIKGKHTLYDFTTENPKTHILSAEEIFGKNLATKIRRLPTDQEKITAVCHLGFSFPVAEKFATVEKIPEEVLNEIYWISNDDPVKINSVSNALGLGNLWDIE